MTPDALFEISGAVLKRVVESTSAKTGEPLLLPRLVVYGSGTGSALVFNLEIRNLGAGVAYDVGFAVPQKQQEANKAQLQRLPEVNMRSSLRWNLRRVVRLNDIGLHLAPGESVEVYFGEYPLRDGKAPCCLSFVPRQYVDLHLSWHCRLKGLPAPRWKHSARHKLLIHSLEGASSPAMRWTATKQSSSARS